MERIPIQVDSLYQSGLTGRFPGSPYDHIVSTPYTGTSIWAVSSRLAAGYVIGGVYALENNETKLSDVINMAGGLLERMPIPMGAQLFRIIS